MTDTAEAIYIGIDNSRWMVDECSDNFDAQCEAIEFYCETKLDANPDSVVGLFTMSSCRKKLLLWPPSSDLGEIMDKVQDVLPGYGNLDVLSVATTPIPYQRICHPDLKKRILLFVGGPTNLYPTSVDEIAEIYKATSVALDVVNFYLEADAVNFTASGYHFGRSALDALVTATNVDGYSCIAHVQPESSIKDVLSKSILEKKSKNDDYAGPLGIEYGPVKLYNGETLAH